MRLTLFVKPVVLVCCFFLLMLVACGPALDAVAPATRRVVDATFSPTPTMVPLSAAADTLPATATIPLPEPSPTMVTAVVTATVTSLSEGQGCEQPFADVTSATEDVINEGLQRMEDSGTAALAWPPQAWDVIVDQTVAAGAIFLDECTDRDTPLAEQPERLNRLAELGRVIPQMEFTLPVEVADGGLAKRGTTFQRLRFACSTRLTRQVGHTWPCLAFSTIQPATIASQRSCAGTNRGRK